MDLCEVDVDKRAIGRDGIKETIREQKGNEMVSLMHMLCLE